MDLKTFKRPFIIAHRGYKAKYPENTLSAFNAATDAGAQMIEMDVRLTKDRKVVIMHDESLDRTTDGYGLVKDRTLEELKQLDAGSWFHPKYAGERIPTLEEVLSNMTGRVLLNIEIKAAEYDPNQPPDAIEQQVIQHIQRRKALASVLISSFEPKILENVVATQNEIPIAFISSQPADQDTLRICQRLKIFSWHPNMDIVTREQVRMMHKAKINVFPYNVNSPKDFQKSIQMKADGVIVDDIRMAKEGSDAVSSNL
jgi:glycerophosphoryl diester phosphodiesterase